MIKLILNYPKMLVLQLSDPSILLFKQLTYLESYLWGSMAITNIKENYICVRIRGHFEILILRKNTR